MRTGRSIGGSAGRRRRRDRGGKRPGNVAVRSTKVVLMVLMGRGDWRILTASTSMKWTDFIISFNRVRKKGFSFAFLSKFTVKFFTQIL